MSGGYRVGEEWCGGTAIAVDAANTRGTTVVAGAGSFSSFVQLVAATANDTAWIEVTVQTNASANTANVGLIEIAVGAAGSEIVLIPDLPMNLNAAGLFGATYLFPVSIPAGTRISAAAKDTSADTFYVIARLFNAGFSGDGFSGVDSMGVSGVHGTAISPSATPNTKGSYGQIIAATARDYAGIEVSLDGAGGGVTNAPYLIDVAIGGAGAEQIILPDWWVSAGGGGQFIPPVSTFLPIEIPTGTRISARAANSVGGGTLGVIVYGVYK